MKKELQKDSKELLSQRIEREIEKLIRNGEIPVGGKLPTEQQFCDQFSVSRNAIRPALKSLSARGLVRIVKGSGVYVNEIDPRSVTEPIDLFFEMSNTSDLILHTIHMRQLVEPEVASVAAMKRTDEHLKKMELNLALMSNCPLYDLDREAEIDREFHSTVSDAAGNPVVNLLMEPIYKLITKYKLPVFAKSEQLVTQEARELMMSLHQSIYEAIKAKDGREAFFLMREHIKLTEANYLKCLKVVDK